MPAGWWVDAADIPDVLWSYGMGRQLRSACSHRVHDPFEGGCRYRRQTFRQGCRSLGQNRRSIEIGIV